MIVPGSVKLVRRPRGSYIVSLAVSGIRDTRTRIHSFEAVVCTQESTHKMP